MEANVEVKFGLWIRWSANVFRRIFKDELEPVPIIFIVVYFVQPSHNSTVQVKKIEQPLLLRRSCWPADAGPANCRGIGDRFTSVY
jgi:hypothetical protein